MLLYFGSSRRHCTSILAISHIVVIYERTTFESCLLPPKHHGSIEELHQYILRACPQAYGALTLTIRRCDLYKAYNCKEYMTFPVKPLVLCLLSIQQLYVQYQKMLPFAHFSMILLGLGSIMVQSIYAVEKAYPARKVTTPIPGTDLFPEYTTDIVCKLDFYCAYPPK